MTYSFRKMLNLTNTNYKYITLLLFPLKVYPFLLIYLTIFARQLKNLLKNNAQILYNLILCLAISIVTMNLFKRHKRLNLYYGFSIIIINNSKNMVFYKPIFMMTPHPSPPFPFESLALIIRKPPPHNLYPSPIFFWPCHRKIYELPPPLILSSLPSPQKILLNPLPTEVAFP